MWDRAALTLARPTKIVMGSALLVGLLSSAWADPQDFSAYMLPDEQHALFEYGEGYVLVDGINEIIEVHSDSSGTYYFTFLEAAEFIENEPWRREQLLLDLRASVSDPETASVFLRTPHPDWGLPGSSSGGGLEPVPFPPLDPRCTPQPFSTRESRCVVPLECAFIPCDNACAMNQGGCAPFTGPWGYSHTANHMGHLFGETAAERQCAEAHFRQWLANQGETCENAVAVNTVAVGAGALAVSACRSGAGSGALACAGSVVVFFATAWQGRRLHNRCLSSYPGHGGLC